MPAELPGALDILLPDIGPYRRDRGPPDLFDLLFFDLETTGLSGGAGTVAFLAAFGRFAPAADTAPAGAIPATAADTATAAAIAPTAAIPAPAADAAPAGAIPATAAATVPVPAPAAPRLRIRQYLLLDYPGEGEFLEAALAELRAPGPSGRPPLLVSYNGKTFDAQILKTRCLMNGIRPPEYYHADLLHPCRRLWRRVLPTCSQGHIETAVLGIDRSGDVPGALAPDIWFSFLKTGETAELLGICDHNIRDIAGLAALFAALTRIAGAPAAAPETYNVDPESLALRWFYAARRGPGPQQRLADELLALAAARACPRASALWAGELFRRGRAGEARALLHSLTEGSCPDETRTAAYRALAVDAEWRLRDPALALIYTDYLSEQKNLRTTAKQDIMKRRERLQKKLDPQSPGKKP
jgi:hypothetical protein